MEGLGAALSAIRKSDENRFIRLIAKKILRNARVLKYGGVGCAGIASNLGTLALLLTLGLRPGWIPSAIAGVVSTAGNFVLHNSWTFSDRQHQGPRLVRGLLSFSIVSGISIGITTMLYVIFTRIIAHLTIVNYHFGKLFIPLACQFAAILLGAAASYALNAQFTWPQTPAKPRAKAAQAQI